MPSLRSLDAQNNRISSIAADFGSASALPQLSSLRLDKNAITSLPEAWANRDLIWLSVKGTAGVGFEGNRLQQRV